MHRIGGHIAVRPSKEITLSVDSVQARHDPVRMARLVLPPWHTTLHKLMQEGSALMHGGAMRVKGRQRIRKIE